MPGPRVIHLFPVGAGWRVAGEDGIPAGEFPTLGAALDATTSGTELTRVVVHDREPVRRAS